MSKSIEIPPKVRPFWEAFEAYVGANLSHRFYEVTYFADSQPSADALAQLVLAGKKRATAGLVWSYEADGLPLPSPGMLTVVTDWVGDPVCIVETTRVDIVPYNEVSEEFAATEGEGDGSLAYWQRAHWAYYGRECRRIGKEPSPTMLIACERFKVVYPP